MKNILKKQSYTIVAVILFSIIAFIFLLNSPLHPWINGETGTDSSVFKTVVLMMEKGYMPYKDSFDHKGPYLYILNYIGNKISQYRGIWVIEYMSLLLTMLAMYKIARLCCGRLFSCITVFISISLLYGYFEGGNLTEEYAMPLIAVSLYIFLDYIINKRVTKFRLILCGICFGATVFDRVNMIAVWLVFGVAIFIVCLLKKQYRELRELVTFFLAGFCIIAIPIILWLAARGALTDFWRDYVIFNVRYSSSSGGRATFAGKLESFEFFFNNNIIICATIIAAYLCVVKDKLLYGIYLCYLLASLMLICISGMQYGHYGMVLVPAIIFPTASLLGYFCSKETEQAERLLVFIAAVFLMGNVIIPKCFSINNVTSAYKDREAYKISPVTDTIVNYIVNNTTEDDRISVYGNWDIIYILSNRMHATRYSYQFPICEVQPAIRTEYIEELKNEMPPVIVVSNGNYDNTISSFLKENGYSLTWKKDEAVDYMDTPLVFSKFN